MASASNVVSQLSTILTADRLSPANKDKIEEAFSAKYLAVIDAGGTAAEAAKAALAVAQVLMVSIPEFHSTNQVYIGDTARTPTPRATKDGTVPYKAIIHINLFGGMDSMNMLVPHPDGCADLYQEYIERRGSDLSLDAATEAVKIDVDAATSDPQPCTSFGVNNHLSSLADIYNASDGIFFVNIG